MSETTKVLIKVAVVVAKTAATYFLAKKIVEAGDKRWGKNPQQ